MLKETTIEFSIGKVFNPGHNFFGELFLTNERLVIKQSLTSDIVAIVPLESLVFIEPFSFGAWKFKRYGFRVSFPNQNGSLMEVRICALTGRGEEWAADWIAALQEARKLRVEALSMAQKTFVIDFSALRELVEKGGIVLTTFKCPHCGAPIKLPEEGTEIICNHCRSTIYAKDIFDKIKSLIS